MSDTRSFILDSEIASDLILMRRTFLFLGFSFSDPHLDFVLSELKRDLGQNIRAHYSIMRRESPEGRSPRRFRYALNRQKLHVEDLERYGIKRRC